MTKTNSERFEVSDYILEAAFARVETMMQKRLKQKGRLCYVSTHEALGVITEEYFEFVDAVKANDLDEFEKEVIDIAVGAVFACASATQSRRQNEH